MDRNKLDKRPLWQKHTRGTMYLRTWDGGKRPIKPKQQIRATPEQLGNKIDQFDLIDGDVDVEKYKTSETPSPSPLVKEEYVIDHVGSGWYNVLSPGNKVMNVRKLRAADAENLKIDLEATQEEDA